MNSLQQTPPPAPPHPNKHSLCTHVGVWNNNGGSSLCVLNLSWTSHFSMRRKTVTHVSVSLEIFLCRKCYLLQHSGFRESTSLWAALETPLKVYYNLDLLFEGLPPTLTYCSCHSSPQTRFPVRNYHRHFSCASLSVLPSNKPFLLVIP